MKSENESGQINQVNYLTNLDLVIDIAVKTRKRLEDLSVSDRIRVVRCGEEGNGKLCPIYMIPVDGYTPTTQIIPRGGNHTHDQNTLLSDSKKLLESINKKVDKQIRKMGL